MVRHSDRTEATPSLSRTTIGRRTGNGLIAAPAAKRRASVGKSGAKPSLARSDDLSMPSGTG